MIVKSPKFILFYTHIDYKKFFIYKFTETFRYRSFRKANGLYFSSCKHYSCFVFFQDFIFKSGSFIKNIYIFSFTHNLEFFRLEEYYALCIFLSFLLAIYLPEFHRYALFAVKTYTNETALYRRLS